MSPAFIRYYRQSKRFLLKKLIPEILWPKQVKLDGVYFKVRNAPYSAGTKYILSTGKYEWPERQLLAGFIKPGDKIIEMGGSIGVLTAIMANRIGSSGQLISIEASKDLVSCSAPWLEENSNTRVVAGFAFPVYSCAENIRINSFDESAGALAGSVNFDWLPTENFIQKIPGNQATVFDLKTIEAQFGIRPNVLIVDIEGSERIILDDRAAFTNSIEHILIELHPAHYGKQIREDIVAKIRQLGYAITGQEENTCLFRKTSGPIG